MTATTKKHGYSAYTHGCRCDTCKTAKRTYMHSRRLVQQPQPNEQDKPFTHGTRSGYEERACRCYKCRAAKSAAYYRETRAKK